MPNSGAEILTYNYSRMLETDGSEHACCLLIINFQRTRIEYNNINVNYSIQFNILWLQKKYVKILYYLPAMKKNSSKTAVKESRYQTTDRIPNNLVSGNKLV